MSEESNFLDLSIEKDENFDNETAVMKGTVPELASHSDESPARENSFIPANQALVKENLKFAASAEFGEKIKLTLKSQECHVEATDPSPPEQQPNMSDASSETKSVERAVAVDESVVKSTTSDAPSETERLEGTVESIEKSTASNVTNHMQRTVAVDESFEKSVVSDGSTETKHLEGTHDSHQFTMKSNAPGAFTDNKSLERSIAVDESIQSTTSDASTESKPLERTLDGTSTTSSEISSTQVPASEKVPEGESIQLINEGLKDMKISTEDIPVTASAKKGRKPPTTPRARSTPVKPLTSPPLTRSRSRDLRKFPSTPSSPKTPTSKKDSDEVKGVRGRQRVKKN